MAEQVVTLPNDSSLHETSRVSKKRFFVRLTYGERVQHMVFVSCFIVLAMTGLMLKLPESAVVKVLGQARETVFYYRGILHRVAAVIMMLTSFYHLYYLVFKKAGRRWFMDMIPRPKDLTDKIGTMLFYIGIKKTPPQYDRFCYKQKMEYGALLVGSTLMTITGLMLWTEFLWSRFWVDLATIIHGMEAVLACLAIMIWHLYEVYLRPHESSTGNVWIHGIIDEEQMKEEHPLHYEKIMSDPKLQDIYIVTEDQ
jgi:cytochrome b subunit of formate dehydrogenase